MDYTWILIAATFAITLFLAYLRMKDLMKHRALLKTVLEREKLVEAIKRPGQKTALYLFGVATIVFAVLTFFTPEPATSIAYIAVFVILTYTEWDNVKTIEKIHIFEKCVVYGVSEFRIKSIRTVNPSGKKNKVVMMLDGTSAVVPSDVGDKLVELQKARKAK